MNRTGIEWADYTWNPMVGCTHGCGFCYARAQAKRRKPGVRSDGRSYGCQLCYDFMPHLHPERLEQPAAVKSSRIVFCGSMGDLFDPNVDPDWRHQVWAAMNEAWWHHYILLTKRPDLVDAEELWQHTYYLGDGDVGPGRLWLGVSVTCDDDWWRVERLLEIREVAPHGTLISFEPLLGPIEHDIPREIGWVIVGAQSGRGAVSPDEQWVLDIGMNAWMSRDRSVFEKDNLAGIVRRGLTQQWPEAMLMEGDRKRSHGGVAAREPHPPSPPLRGRQTTSPAGGGGGTT